MFAAVSSGNHGQGFALACRLQGASAHVVMPKPFSAMKHRAVVGYGAQVHVVEDRSCADARLRELVDDYHAVVVHPFNDPFVIAGQGTVMVEFIDQVGDLDIVLGASRRWRLALRSLSRGTGTPTAHGHLCL